MPSDARPPIPITVFTGFLGAGKTSIILSLLPQLPKDYRVVLLKNEFGDVEVDSQLAKQSSLTAVSEILNGCMCCVLVGQMKTALLEILENYHPDRIIIECSYVRAFPPQLAAQPQIRIPSKSGSAFPATLAFQIRELERETHRALALDAIVTVIDAENFRGYEDTSVTAKMQAQYTDVLLLVCIPLPLRLRLRSQLPLQNKWEHISERALDDVLDHLNTLNDLTPKVRCQGPSVDPSLIFGLDTKLFLSDSDIKSIASTEDHRHHDEVETVTLSKGSRPHPSESESKSRAASQTVEPIDSETLTAALSSLSKECVYRVKGFVLLPSGLRILNWAFGRWELVEFNAAGNHSLVDVAVRLTVMGERGEVKRLARKLAERLGAEVL
ncbi:CobW/HypB/UreG, nucleotide-binding domain-containing protein [Amylostereum chailletii]|nr:CobW/HypB/UreG, nucleotide-binding domain-containing protein [Amylostereum chailletii]